MSTEFYFIAVMALNIVNLGLLAILAWPRKVDKSLSRIIRQFEREKDCMLRIEMIEADNVYLRNPKR